MNRVLTASFLAALFFVPITPALAQVSYVKICPTYGAGWAYLPGSPTCYNVQTGETRTETGDGTVYGQLDMYAAIDQANEGVALSLALPTAVVDPGKTFGVSVNVGTFAGQSAIGVGAALKAGDGLTVNGAVGAGTQQGTVGGRLGANYSW